MNGALVVLLIVVVGAGGWYAHVRLYPWRSCPACTRGRRYSGEAHRDCKRCGATGRVRRLGAPREDRR